METIFLKVYTPEGAVLNEKAQSITLQTAEGEIGILPGHARYIGLLGTGMLSYISEGGNRSSIVVSEGFAHFIDGTLTVLADAVDVPDDATGRNLTVEKQGLLKELTDANFFDPVWDVKRVQLKRLESLEALLQNRH